MGPSRDAGGCDRLPDREPMRPFGQAGRRPGAPRRPHRRAAAPLRPRDEAAPARVGCSRRSRQHPRRKERQHVLHLRSPARRLHRRHGQLEPGQGPALGAGAGALRDVRPRLPLALRDALQLRADVGAPRRLHLVRPLRGRPAVRRLDYDVGAPRPRGRRHHLATPPATRPWACTPCGRCATRCLRIGDPALLPDDERQRLRLEDLLGFRRNPITATPLFRRFRAKALDGHPTPATPFVRLSTGASGVGVASSIGLGSARATATARTRPRVHIVEGEGGLTPGRVAEALAAAGTACLDNVVLHVDWNQASIDCEHVCRDGDEPGDYVQWDPRGALLPARLERHLRAATARLPAGRRGAAARGDARTTASPRPSCTAP